jgi:hypothetical protein
MKREPHPAIWVFGLVMGLMGFVVLASEAWSAAKVVMFWQPGVAVVTGFREKGRPRPLQERLTVVFVQTSLPNGRQVSGFTVNDQWSLKNWPREEVT